MNLTNIEGRNPVIEVLKSDRQIDKIMIANGAKEGSIKKIIGMAKDKNVVVQYVNKNKLDEISTSHAHQGVIAIVSEYKYYELEELIEKAKATNEDMFFIILDEITDPHNLGTIIRTADAVGAHGVIIPKRRSVHITPIVAKASAGAVEYVPVCKVTNIVNTIKRLKEEGLWIAAADMDGEVFYEQNLTGPIGLVIGSEGFGISRLVKQNCDFTVKMPMTGNVTSLNASVAGGILLYEIFRQRNNLKEISKVDLDGAREKLVHYIIEYAQYTGKKAIIVFDAYNVKNSKEKIEERKYITIVYTKEHQTADSYIEKYISSLSKYDDIEVATSDYAEQQIILGKGASRISARELKLYVDSAMVKIKEEQEKRQQKIQRNFLEERLDKDILSKLENIRRKR